MDGALPLPLAGEGWGGGDVAPVLAERAPPPHALLGTLPRKRERVKKATPRKTSTILLHPAVAEHINHALPDRRLGGL
jgi:hypothetical protein